MKDDGYPNAVDAHLVGTYPSLAKAGGGYVWDDVLEYRVWCHPERGAVNREDGSDYYFAFATYAEAAALSAGTKDAEEPLALIRQVEYIEEPMPGKYRHVKELRVTEWPAEFLRRPRRAPNTIPDFLSPDAPKNRLEIIRGFATRND
jgi:putative acetyltransferase